MTLKILCILVLGMVANVYIPAAPSILGALVDYQGWSASAAGQLIAFNFWGGAVSTVLAVFFLHRPGWNLRLTMLGCLLTVALTSVGSVWLVSSFEWLIAMRFISGIGAGLGFTVASVALVGTARAERSYALLYGSPFVISGAALAGLPFIYQAFGIEGAFYGMGALNLLACGLLRYFPASVSGNLEENKAAVPVTLKSIYLLPGLVLAALFLHYVFNSGIWTYFERLGVAYGMSPATAGAILGPSMSASIIGMIAAAVLGDRFGYLKPIYSGTVLIVLATLALLFSRSEVVFGLGTAVFNASITFVTPYFIVLLALIVPSGRGVSSANVATLTGFSVGPFLVSFLLFDANFRPAIFFTAGGFMVVLILMLVFTFRLKDEARVNSDVQRLFRNPRPG